MGIPVFGLFPNVAGDCEFAWCGRCTASDQSFPRRHEHTTGKPLRQFEHPCLGSWVTYALEPQTGFCLRSSIIGRPSSPVPTTGGLSGCVLFRYAVPAGDRHPDLMPPQNSDARAERQMRSSRLNHMFCHDYRDRQRSCARVKQYELAANMMMTALPCRFQQRTTEVKDLYGMGEKDTDDFGNQLLRQGDGRNGRPTFRFVTPAEVTAPGMRTAT